MSREIVFSTKNYVNMCDFHAQVLTGVKTSNTRNQDLLRFNWDGIPPSQYPSLNNPKPPKQSLVKPHLWPGQCLFANKPSWISYKSDTYVTHKLIGGHTFPYSLLDSKIQK